MDPDRDLIPTIRESYRPRGGEGEAWVYNPAAEWATYARYIMKVSKGANGPEERLERNMVLCVTIPLHKAQ